jgi:hypothetical protein
MAKKKVRLLVSTKGAKSGTVISVDEEVVADLVANRQAVEVSAAKKSED